MVHLLKRYFLLPQAVIQKISENVWNSVVPYLRAVPEVGEYGNNTWEKTLTLSQLDSLLSSKGENIGSAQDIVITKISTGDRVQK